MLGLFRTVSGPWQHVPKHVPRFGLFRDVYFTNMRQFGEADQSCGQRGPGGDLGCLQVGRGRKERGHETNHADLLHHYIITINSTVEATNPEK